jgi:hypothetical protein
MQRQFATTLVAAAVGLVVATSVSAAEEQLRAGAYAVDITPESFPVSSNGGMTDRQVTSAHDPLHARCLVLDNGETSIAIVVCDNCAIPREILDGAKQLAAEATGIPVEHMLMSATHTHSAVTVTSVFQSEPELEYIEFLKRRIAEGVAQAHKQLAPARIGWGVGEDPTQVFNRRWFTDEGVVNDDPFGRTTDVVRMNPGFDKSITDRTSGPVDPQVCILSVQSADGRPIALLANYSLHYVGGVPGDTLSADYFAEFASLIAQKIGATNVDPPFVGIMSNGTSGNINNINYGAEGPIAAQPFERMRVVAASVADAAMEAYKSIDYHDWVPLRVATREVELGVRKPDAQELTEAQALLAHAGPGPYSDRKLIYARESVFLAEYPDTVRAQLQAIRVGDAGIVSSPCETFVETGLAIKAESPLQPTFCIELANGYNGYLPTPEHHEWGGYETWRARSSYLAVDAEPIIRRTLLELLSDVAAESN